jgi:hypothetical protein
MPRFNKYAKTVVSTIQHSDRVVRDLQDFINDNVTGWECVSCNVCGRNSDYEHTSTHADCVVGLAMRLRDMLGVRRFRAQSHTYSQCRYVAHYYHT